MFSSQGKCSSSKSVRINNDKERERERKRIRTTERSRQITVVTLDFSNISWIFPEQIGFKNLPDWRRFD